MKHEKIGGYETRLTPRAEEYRERNMSYEDTWNRGQIEARPEDVVVVEHILSRMQLDELRDTFAEYLRRSDVPAEAMNTEAMQRIFARPLHAGDAAVYAQLTNHVSISTVSRDFVAAKEMLAEGHDLPERLSFKLQMYLVHEICHGLSRNRITSEDITESETILHQESGYHAGESVLYRNPDTDTTQSELSLNSFEAFNEGVTQRMTEEVFVEYARRTGVSGPAERFLTSVHEQATTDLPRYVIYGNQIDNLCDRIGSYAGVPKETVWQGLKRGYFEQPQLFHKDTINLFAETFGADFLRHHGSLNNGTSIGKLGMFDAAYDIPHPSGYAEKWLQHLGIQHTA